MDKPYYMTAGALGEDEDLSAPVEDDTPVSRCGGSEGVMPYYIEPGEMYTGFLFIKCGHCGAERAFFARNATSSYRCRECGERTALGELVPVDAICKCGNRVRYKTNAREWAVDIPCLRCESPVAVEYIERLKRYVTMGVEIKRKKRKG